SRLRGMMLMALANSSNALLLSTANKSEAATGYGTLYGDLCGALAPLKDVYKTKVYKLCQWRNQDIPNGALGPKRMIIPPRILTKAPTAELRPNQKDEDSLPPYETLDKILKLWVEEELPREQIIAQGFEDMLVDKVLRLVDLAEYKRRQAPPGLKISKRAFGRDRRYPITNRFILGQENDIKAIPKTNKKASS
ncbi:MAG: NAD(+) synthase, partial [Dongiaceae bacterium]